ncbi:hypothetical protein Tco_1358324, partial [Tanacetum coccineum]
GWLTACTLFGITTREEDSLELVEEGVPVETAGSGAMVAGT